MARALLNGLVSLGFDITFAARVRMDQEATHAIEHVLPADMPMVPFVVNCSAPHLPTLERCSLLGDALAAIVRADTRGRRVALIGTGGLWHQLPFPGWRSPRTNGAFDAWCARMSNGDHCARSSPLATT